MGKPITDPKLLQSLERFKTEICNHSKDIDPSSERDWYDLSLGFFLAIGHNIDDATDLAVYARYTCQYWCGVF